MAAKKIAVLGGGCGAMAAVFALTDRPGWRDEFDITVYQPGWRLGGKGAAGRNADAGYRIEEHGLHIWSGFYENAFWMMRKCYTELNRPSTHPLATAFSAFSPRHYTGLGDHTGKRWVFWKGYLPHDSGLPGDFIEPGLYKTRGEIRSPWDLMCNVVFWSLCYIETTSNARSASKPEPGGEPSWMLKSLLWTSARENTLWGRFKSWCDGILLGVILLRMLSAFRSARRFHDKGAAEKARAPETFVPQSHTARPYRRLSTRVECLRWWLHRRLDTMTSRNLNQHSFYILGDLFTTMMIGMLRDGAIAKGFDVMDDKDLRAWLQDHGVHAKSLHNPTVSSAYSYVFSFVGGDTDQPQLAAGVAIRLLLRLLLCSRGAVFWEMQGGMGDTVFAPIYEVLKQRGVKFRYFHRAWELKSKDGKLVDEIIIGRQATLKPEHPEYDPLITVNGLPAWPSVPKYEELIEGDEMQRKFADGHCEIESMYTDWEDRERITLRRGEHFDDVVLGTSLAPAVFICDDLAQKNQNFRNMVANIKTVRTQSMQLWTTKSLFDLGWQLPSPVICSFGEPFDTWADLTVLLQREAWSGKGGYPRSIIYLCGAMKDDAQGILPPGPRPGYLKAARRQVTENAQEWLKLYSDALWPDAMLSGAKDLNFALLHRDNGGTDAERFNAQWFSANVDLSERYVLALPGTTRFRLKAGESGFSNLVLAGDWVLNGLNYGCVESAVLGGFQAARAIGGYPKRIFGEHDIPSTSPFQQSSVASH